MNDVATFTSQPAVVAPPLWEHQKRDIEFCLANREVFNTSDPGTGKTRTCIELIKQLDCPALIFATKSILQPAWGDDFDKYAPGIKYAIATAGKQREQAFKCGAQVVITNHDAAVQLRDNMDWWYPMRDGLFIYDESTAAKNPQAKRAQAAFQIRQYFSRAICLTGTPNPNGILDLWQQMLLVDKGQRLGTRYFRFRNEVCEPTLHRGGFTTWEEKPGMGDAVGMLIADCTIRNRRDDCLDLPEHQVHKVRFHLSQGHMDTYRQMKSHAVMVRQQHIVSAVNAAAMITKLLQIASGAVYDETEGYVLIDTARYELAMDLVEERDHSVVVFNWRHQRQELEKEAQKRKLAYRIIDGTVTGKGQRDDAIAAFQAGKLRCLFVHPQSAGHGLTLTKGVATIHCSPTYNAELFEQVNARIFRGGQTRKTETILIEAAGTIEAEVYRRLQNKCLAMQDLLELLT